MTFMIRFFILLALILAFALNIMTSAFAAGPWGYGPYTIAAPIAIDGDTLRADVLIWPTLTADVAIRVIGVDTPEISQPKCDAEKTSGLAAKEFTNNWLSIHLPITINTVKLDAYSGRVDAVVIGNNGELLSADLIKAGHGRAYGGGKRQSWCP